MQSISVIRVKQRRQSYLGIGIIKGQFFRLEHSDSSHHLFSSLLTWPLSRLPLDSPSVGLEDPSKAHTAKELHTEQEYCF
jgi:hypothetical protein